jgi:hypothetical protein
MLIDLNEHIPADFHDQSRVWIYQCSRIFLLAEAMELEKMLQDFAAGWKSHGDPVKGYANLFYGRFIVLMADESNTAVSGCSTDSSVALMRNIEQQFQVQLFDRQNLAFVRNDKIETIPMSQLPYAMEHGFIGADTLYFDNTVLTKLELLQRWIAPVQSTWLARFLPKAAEKISNQ